MREDPCDTKCPRSSLLNFHTQEVYFPSSQGEMRTIYEDCKQERSLVAGAVLPLASQRKLQSPDNSFLVLSLRDSSLGASLVQADKKHLSCEYHSWGVWQVWTSAPPSTAGAPLFTESTYGDDVRPQSVVFICTFFTALFVLERPKDETNVHLSSLHPCVFLITSSHK